MSKEDLFKLHLFSDWIDAIIPKNVDCDNNNMTCKLKNLKRATENWRSFVDDYIGKDEVSEFFGDFSDEELERVEKNIEKLFN